MIYTTDTTNRRRGRCADLNLRHIRGEECLLVLLEHTDNGRSKLGIIEVWKKYICRVENQVKIVKTIATSDKDDIIEENMKNSLLSESENTISCERVVDHVVILRLV